MSSLSFDYESLIEKFLCREISAEDFQKTYVAAFKSEEIVDERLYEALDEAFGDVDSFTRDQRLLNENPNFYLDETELRRRVSAAASRISMLKSRPI